jgi:hypothetical protein
MYNTKDMILAVGLMCQGYSVISVDVDRFGKATFIFEEDEKLNKAIGKFMNYELKVEPHLWESKRRTAKSMIGM